MTEELSHHQNITGDENVQVMGDYNIITILRSSQSRDLRRSEILEKVHIYWIAGLLEPSLADAFPLRLQFSAQVEAIEEDEDTLLPLVQEMKLSSHFSPEGTDVLQAFEQANRQLLILGEPGSGKTTLLLQLTRELLLQASRYEEQPIPVVFPLSSWTLRDRKTKKQSFDYWLVEELNNKYKVPLEVAKKWIDGDKVLPLLDGLDEISVNDREDCVKAINAYHQIHRVRLVICSRSQDYFDIGVKLHLGGAITVQPLTNQQIEAYLSIIGEQSSSLPRMVEDDPLLDKLIKSPLMFQILVKADHTEPLEEILSEDSLKDILSGDSLETHQRQLFAHYVQRMLHRRKASSRYKDQQTIFWLGCLARQLVHHDMLDYGVTDSIWQSRVSGGGTMLGFGIVISLLFGIVFGLFFALRFNILFTILVSLGLTLVAGFCLGVINIILKIIVSFSDMLFGGVVPGVNDSRPALSSLPRLDVLDGIIFPGYMGIAMILSFAEGVIVGFILNNVLLSYINSDFKVIIGLIAVLILWVFLGFIQFWVGKLFCFNLFLRFNAWYLGYRPFQYKQFLDYAVDRVLMYKVGNQYRFIHKLIHAYFASLS
jgi:GTPase SAR1 family protein